MPLSDSITSLGVIASISVFLGCITLSITSFIQTPNSINSSVASRTLASKVSKVRNNLIPLEITSVIKTFKATPNALATVFIDGNDAANSCSKGKKISSLIIFNWSPNFKALSSTTSTLLPKASASVTISKEAAPKVSVVTPIIL